MAAKRKQSKAKQTKPAARRAVRRPAAQRKPAKRARPLRQQPESLRLRSTTPSFTVSDIAKSLAWYRDVVGFTVTESWERDGKLAGVELAAGSAGFMIGQDDWKLGRDRKKGEGFRIYCITAQDIDRLAKQIEARGGTLAHQPQDEPWGMRDFALVDPDGFKITIAANLKR